MDDEEIVTQLGLLLTQLRYMRRAMENIENSTAHYGGVTFAVALAAGPKFGEPPLLNGALKVYVVNISDLNVSSGMGFFESLLGGIGRFFGGLAGGFVGGTIGGVALIAIFNRIGQIVADLKVIIPPIQDLVKGVNAILDKLGVGAKQGAEAGGKEKGEENKEGVGGTLSQMVPTLDMLTALFTAASAGPNTAAKNASEATTASAKTWKETFDSLTGTLKIADSLIQGLILLVPEVIGGLALLLVRLDSIKVALLELLKFGLIFALALRGAVLVTLYDTLSAVARLAAALLGILQNMFSTILPSVFAIIGSVAAAVQAFIKFIGGGLKNTVDAIVEWLVNGLGAVLTYIGNLKVFQLVTHIVVVLPNILPALATLMGKELKPDDITALGKAADTKLPAPTTPAAAAAAVKKADFPNVGEKFLGGVVDFQKSLADTKTILTGESDKAFNAARGGLNNIDAKLKAALDPGETQFTDKLRGDLQNVEKNAIMLGRTLNPAIDAAQKAAEASQQGGLGRLADAYEKWLTGDGFKTLLGEISKQFTIQKELPGAAVKNNAPEPVRATVEIKELIIDLKPGDEKSLPIKGGVRASLDFDFSIPGYDEREQRGAIA